MPELIVIWDIQHVGKASRPEDRGAIADLNGDGVVGHDEKEASLVGQYVYAGIRVLGVEGVRSWFVGWGDYGHRHRMACRLAREFPETQFLYLACHLNAGGGRYALILPDARSTEGQLAAPRVAMAIGTEFSVDPRVRSATATDWTKNALYTIGGIYDGPRNIRGLCVEPLFIDGHRALMTPHDLERLGEAIAAGVIDWWRSATHLNGEAA